MQGDTRTLLVLGTAGVLAWFGWTAAQDRWWARVRAERTAVAYARAVYRQDSTALTRITVSGSAHNSLCAGRWSLTRACTITYVRAYEAPRQQVSFPYSY
jgi:hypothetical protein